MKQEICSFRDCAYEHGLSLGYPRRLLITYRETSTINYLSLPCFAYTSALASSPSSDESVLMSMTKGSGRVSPGSATFLSRPSLPSAEVHSEARVRAPPWIVFQVEGDIVGLTEKEMAQLRQEVE